MKSGLSNCQTHTDVWEEPRDRVELTGSAAGKKTKLPVPPRLHNMLVLLSVKGGHPSLARSISVWSLAQMREDKSVKLTRSLTKLPVPSKMCLR